MKKFFCSLILLSALFKSQSQPCTRVVDTEYFNNASNFTAAGAGNVFINGGVCNWVAAFDGVTDRLYRPLAYTLSDNYFKATFKFTFSPNPQGSGVGAALLALTAGNLDLLCYDSTQNYATTNQDGLGVIITCADPGDSIISNWTIALEEKDGNVRTLGTNKIPIDPNISIYYVVLERIGGLNVSIKLYSDHLLTQLVGQCSNTITTGITGLNFMQFGNLTWGFFIRQFNGTVDSVVICDDFTTGINGISAEGDMWEIISNPSNGNSLTVNSNFKSNVMLHIYDSKGALVKASTLLRGLNNLDINFSGGLYSIVIYDASKNYMKKILVN